MSGSQYPLQPPNCPNTPDKCRITGKVITSTISTIPPRNGSAVAQPATPNPTTQGTCATCGVVFTMTSYNPPVETVTPAPTPPPSVTAPVPPGSYTPPTFP